MLYVNYISIFKNAPLGAEDTEDVANTNGMTPNSAEMGEDLPKGRFLILVNL